MSSLPNRSTIRSFSKLQTAKPSFQTPLQRMTIQHQQRQKNTQQQTHQQVKHLSKKHQQLTSAAVTAKKPVQQHLQRAGKMVENRMNSLKAKVNGQIK
ncbi:MAG: hypothetical protein HN981_00990 [Candidatus Pacebacteria bacterium]|jgi:hypothetical protein|nr:hypothetical protein [Candidatus Paceibacterota bacterium]MBT6756501.1 hypothetical protein [Candidatus Paceibacterota bacterium]MBT6920951.1 hypothetical protein [Candidatus Paceibacterota bacterium]